MKENVASWSPSEENILRSNKWLNAFKTADCSDETRNDVWTLNLKCKCYLVIL